MLNLAINGYGRIGRSVLRALQESPLRSRLRVVAINEVADAHTVLHLTRYDSTHGRFPGELAGNDTELTINGQPISLLRSESITGRGSFAARAGAWMTRSTQVRRCFPLGESP